MPGCLQPSTFSPLFVLLWRRGSSGQQPVALSHNGKRSRGPWETNASMTLTGSESINSCLSREYFFFFFQNQSSVWARGRTDLWDQKMIQACERNCATAFEPAVGILTLVMIKAARAHFRRSESSERKTQGHLFSLTREESFSFWEKEERQRSGPALSGCYDTWWLKSNILAEHKL